MTKTLNGKSDISADEIDDLNVNDGPIIVQNTNPAIYLTSGSSGTSYLYTGTSSNTDKSSISFDNNNNKSIIRLNDTNIFGFTSSSRLGIGTVSPDYNIHVTSAGNNILALIDSAGTATNSIYLGDTSAPDDGFIAYNNATQHLRFQTAGTISVVLDESGNLGIGTNVVPAYQLHVVNSSNATASIQSGDTSISSLLLGSSSNPDAGAVKYDNNTNTFTFRVNDTDITSITSSGEVVHTGFMKLGEATGNIIALVSNNSSINKIAMGDTDDFDAGFILYDNSSNGMSFYTNSASTARFNINSSGVCSFPSGELRLKNSTTGSSSSVAGNIIFDTSSNKLKFYNGSGWETITSA